MNNARLLNTRKSLRHIDAGLRVIVGVAVVLVATIGVSIYTFLHQLGETADVQTWLDRGAATFAGEVMHIMGATKDATAAFAVYDDDADIEEKIDFAENAMKLIFTPNTVVGETVSALPTADAARKATLQYLRVARIYLNEKPRTEKTRQQLRESLEESSAAMQKLRLELIGSESRLRDSMISAVRAGRMIAFLAIPAILLAVLLLVVTVFVIRSTARKWALAEEERNRHLACLMASISHDLRTPLQAVMGAASIMASKHLARRDSDKYMEIVTQSASRLKQLVDDLFALSRRGTINVTHEPIRLSAWIRRAVLTHWMVAEQKGLKFELISNLTENVTVVFDESRLTQVVANLIENAIKFTNEGFVRLTISWATKPDNHNGILYITVEDSGVGITKKNKEWIWDPLVYPEEPDENHESTGFGLAIVSEIAKSAGGQVTASATPGKGCRFDVVMPLPLSPHQAFEPRKKERTAPTWPDGVAPTVLIVEDDEAVRHVLNELVAGMGYRTQTTSDGYHALQILRETRCAAVLTDVHTTGMDGLKLAKSIHDEIDPRPAIIAVTSHSSMEPTLKFSQLFDAILFKPVNNDELRETLFNLIVQRQQEHDQAVNECPANPVLPLQESLQSGA